MQRSWVPNFSKPRFPNRFSISNGSICIRPLRSLRTLRGCKPGFILQAHCNRKRWCRRQPPRITLFQEAAAYIPKADTHSDRAYVAHGSACVNSFYGPHAFARNCRIHFTLVGGGKNFHSIGYTRTESL